MTAAAIAIVLQPVNQLANQTASPCQPASKGWLGWGGCFQKGEKSKKSNKSCYLQ